MLLRYEVRASQETVCSAARGRCRGRREQLAAGRALAYMAAQGDDPRERTPQIVGQRDQPAGTSRVVGG
jgi:hypothetical protein